MNRGSRNRGFTLIEVAVYSSILLLLFGGIFMVVEGGARYFRLAAAHETVNQQAVIAMSRIRSELANGTQSAVYPASAPQDHLLFLSPFGINEDTYEYDGTQLIWKKWVCFYRDGTDRLVRAELDSPDDVDPSAPSVPDFTSDILPLQARPIAQNVVGLRFQFFPAPAVIRITVETEEQTSSDQTTNIEMISSVRLVNI